MIYTIEDYFDHIIDYIDLTIYKNNIIFDSISELQSNNIKGKEIYIEFDDEEGFDEGGLRRDWLSTITDEIINTGAIIPTPDGEYYTVNNKYSDNKVFNLIGQVLGVAFNNKQSINLKLMSSIWKFIFNEKVDINDMKEYDNDIYNSLNCIKNSDVTSMYLTFVDSNEEELCDNGKNKEVTNDNKNQYIDRIIQKRLIEDNYSQIEEIRNGFQSAVDISDCSYIGWKEIRDFIKGKENFDIEDMRKNCYYNSDDEDSVDLFFDIISDWPDENLKKLLKFITGTSVVPVEGFEYFDNLGGKIGIQFTNSNKNSYPVSHTCNNIIELPRYESKGEFETKLLIAIEVKDFGLS